MLYGLKPPRVEVKKARNEDIERAAIRHQITNANAYGTFKNLKTNAWSVFRKLWTIRSNVHHLTRRAWVCRPISSVGADILERILRVELLTIYISSFIEFFVNLFICTCTNASIKD